MSERRLAALALLPVAALTILLGTYEAIRARPIADTAVAPGMQLPQLPAPRLGPGTFATYAGRLGISVQDLLTEQLATSEEVRITLALGVDRCPVAMHIEVDLRPLCAAASDPWQGEALYALVDAAEGPTVFESESITTHATAVAGVARLHCIGALTLHGRTARTELDLLLGAERKDRARLQGELAVDLRSHGLPPSWRYGVIRMDPILRVRLDATLARQAKGD